MASARAVAALTRRFGVARLSLVEDAVQDALARVLARTDERPADLTAWLVRAAANRALDLVRRETRLVPLGDDEPAGDADATTPASPLDDELALIFLCCHPALPRASKLALTLRVACGLSTAQIARAFLSDERTLAQRLVRAKLLLRRQEARFELPEPDELPARLSPILEVLYLVFTEGHSPTDGDAALCGELCDEALRLGRLLAAQPRCALPSVHALVALFCFQAARAPARLADDGSLLLLHEQDRSRWDGALLGEGFAALGRAAAGDELSRYHVEAAIAACHAAAPRHDATDWPRIVTLYDELRRLGPSPVVEVNRAVAVGMATGALAGLDELDAIPERALIDRYPYAQAAYAELHASLGQLDEARDHLGRALACQPSAAQRRLLERRLAALSR